MYTEDMGHIAHRRFEHVYTSSPFTWAEPATGATVDVAAEVPDGAALDLAVRSAGSADALEEASWRPLDNGRFTLQSTDRVLQYRAVFRSDNGDRYPVLNRVRIELGR
jgi:hypothetical protein